MKKELEFILTKSAKAGSGDRYEYALKGDSEHMVIHLPQRISRTEGIPFPKVKITIEA